MGRGIMDKDCGESVAEKFYATRNKFIISTGHNKSFRDLRNRASALRSVSSRFIFVYVLGYTLANSILITGHDKFSSKSPAPVLSSFTRSIFQQCILRIAFFCRRHVISYRLLRAGSFAQSLCDALCRLKTCVSL